MLRALQPGDTVAFVSPASPIEEARLQPAIKLLNDEGYNVRVFPHALDVNSYLAGTDADRAKDFQDAFDDPEIAAVICTRGGFGCHRILNLIDFDRIAASGKMLVGFSDITALHIALNRRGCPSLYGPMPLTLSYPREDWVFESWLNALKGKHLVPGPAPKGRCIVSGTVEAKTAGGCLILLSDSLGTSEPLDAEGKILLIEGVEDPSHRVDALLTHLLNAGIPQNAAGIVVGEMTRSDEIYDESIGRAPWRDLVASRLGNLGIPLILDYPFGHYRNMLSLPLGITARLDALSGTLTYTESLCA